MFMLKAAIFAMIFCDIFMFGRIFISPQVKSSEIINNRHGIYELPRELPNE